VIIPGSIVTTSNGVFYIAISLGQVMLEQMKFLVISPDSPIGKLLMGKKLGESIVWNKVTYIILEIE
jgi:hypothetical protein